MLHEGADPFILDYHNRCVEEYRLDVEANLKRSAVDIAWEACLVNDKTAKHLKSLISLSSSDNYALKSNLSLLHKTVLHLNSLGIKQLLESVSKNCIDEKDADGQTPLHWAARRGDVQAVSLLLEAGADSNKKNKRGAGVMTAAIMSGNAQCIWKILDSGCDISYRQKDRYTPLHHCCRYGVDISIVKALLKLGADRNAQTELGHTPLMIATFNSLSATAEFLINSNVDLDIQGKDGGYALHYAVVSGDHKTARNLLGKGADHLLKTVKGETLLHFLAQRQGDYEMVRSLNLFDLDGIDVEDVTTKREFTALQMAEMHYEGDAEWLQMFKELIKKIHLGHSRKKCENLEFRDATEEVA